MYHIHHIRFQYMILRKLEIFGKFSSKRLIFLSQFNSTLYVTMFADFINRPWNLPYPNGSPKGPLSSRGIGIAGINLRVEKNFRCPSTLSLLYITILLYTKNIFHVNSLQ